MDFDSIWYDEVDLVNDNKNDDFDLHYDYDLDETSYSDDDVEEDESATIPVKILDYYLSSARGARLNYIQALSLKNRRHPRHNNNNNIVYNNTRRSRIGTNHGTPKRRRNKMKDTHRKNHKKTKRIIFLK